MNRNEVIDLLEILFAAYPNQKIADAKRMVQVWEMSFGEDPADQIYKAARHHINTSSFFPTIADIRKNQKYSFIYDASPAPKLEAKEYKVDFGCDVKDCEKCPDKNTCFLALFK